MWFELWPLLYIWSYAFLLALIALCVIFFRKGLWLFTVIAVAAVGVFARWRFVEPQQLVVEETDIIISTDEVWVASAHLAVIADIHAGEFKDQRFLTRVVEQIEQLHTEQLIDAVLIAWDFTGYPKSEQLERIFAPLSGLSMPVYAVLGNHDVWMPGDPMIREPLIDALTSAGVNYLYNDYVELANLRLLGVGPYMSNEDDVWMLEIVNEQKDERPFVVLAHNPDTISKYDLLDPNTLPDATIVWHTHCGQIRLPVVYWLFYKAIVPTEWEFDCGLTRHKVNGVDTQLFITPWVWETGLPIRWDNPPTISLVTIK